MNNEIMIKNKQYTVNELSSIEALEAISLAKDFKGEILQVDDKNEYNDELVEVLSEFSVLSFYCLYIDEKRAFKSPLEVLKTLSIDDLCDVYDIYADIRNYSAFQEESYNESFDESFYKRGD